MKAETRDRLMSGWLGQVEPSLAEMILRTGRLKQFADGDEIYGLWQSQNCLHGVASGCVKMLVAVNEQDPKFGHLAGPGFWFGEAAVVTGSASLMEVTASGATETFVITRSQIDQIAADYQAMWPSVALLCVLNLGTAIAVGEDLMIRNSRKRLVALLLRLSSRRSCFQKVPHLTSIPINWNELAEAANLSRSKVGAILSELSKQGLIRTKQKKIEILYATGLERLLKH